MTNDAIEKTQPLNVLKLRQIQEQPSAQFLADWAAAGLAEAEAEYAAAFKTATKPDTHNPLAIIMYAAAKRDVWRYVQRTVLVEAMVMSV